MDHLLKGIDQMEPGFLRFRNSMNFQVENDKMDLYLVVTGCNDPFNACVSRNQAIFSAVMHVDTL